MDPETNNYQGIGSILRIDLITSHSRGHEESKNFAYELYRVLYYISLLLD